MSTSRELERNTVDGRDLVAAVHTRSLRELEQLARAERARVVGNLIAAMFRGLGGRSRGPHANRKCSSPPTPSSTELAATAAGR